MTLLLAALALLPLAAAPLPALLRRAAGLDAAATALAVALGTLALALALLPGALAGGATVAAGPWVPALGMRLALRADRAAVGFAVAVAAGACFALLAARRADRGRALPHRVGGVLALAGATLGAVLADDLALLWCFLELAALAAAWLLGDERHGGRVPMALAALVAMEAGGLALLVAVLLIADVAGGFGLGDALRAGAELRAHPLYPMMAGLTLAAAATRLAPWLLRAGGAGARLVSAAGLAAASWLPLRLGAVLGGTRAWLGWLAAFAAAALLLAAWRLIWVWRGRAEAPVATPSGPSLLDEFALAARVVVQPLVVARPALPLVMVGLGAVLAVALGVNGTRAEAWPGPTSIAWPLAGGSGWLLLALVAVVVRVRDRRAARGLAWVASGALALLAASAPPIALAEVLAGLPALWLLARSLAWPRPSRRALGGLVALVAAAAALHPVLAVPPVAPAVSAATQLASRSALALFAPLALPLAATVVLLVLGGAPRVLRQALAGLAVLANLALAACLLGVADRGAPVSVAIGAWPVPFGIHLLLDRLSAEMLLVAALVAVLAYGHELASPAAGRGRHAEALGQLQLVGLAGCVLAADLFEFVAFLELLLLALQAPPPDGADGRAAMLPVAVLGAAGTGLLLLAAGGIYAAVHASGYADLAVRVPAVAAGASPLLAAGGYLLLIALALRAAALPFGIWLPRALEAAPAVASAFVVVLMEVAVYALMRLYVLVFPCFAAGPCGPSGLVLPLALATLAVGGIGALAATGLRALAPRLLLVAVGTLLVGVGTFRVAGLAAAIYALAPAALAAAALAFIAGVADSAGRRALAGAALLAALGVPPFPGWIGRIGILAASGADAPAVWTLVATTVLMAAIAAARVGGASGDAPAPRLASSRAAAGSALVLLGALTLASGPAFDLASRAARQLLDRQAYIAAFRGAEPGAAAH